MQNFKKQQGQAILVVLLAMAVILTITLSIVSRSVTDISLSTKDEEAARAFSAAEAGIEQALRGITAADSLSSGGTFSASATPVPLASSGTGFVYPGLLASGDVATVWFVSHDSSGNLSCNGGLVCTSGSSMTLTVCWGAQGTGNGDEATPAIEVSVIYTDEPGDYEKTKVARKAFDPKSGRGNGFENAGAACQVDSQNFAFSKDINLGTDMNIPSTVLSDANGLQLARLKLLYNTDKAHPVGVKISSGTLPNQGQTVVSTGKSGDSIRKVQATQLFSDIPPVFDFGVFAGGDLVK